MSDPYKEFRMLLNVWDSSVTLYSQRGLQTESLRLRMCIDQLAEAIERAELDNAKEKP